MARIEGEVVIRRPIDEVFDFAADEPNEPRYNHQMNAAELLTPEPIGRGSRFHAELRVLGRPLDLTVEFNRFERPRVLGSISHSLPRGRRGPSMRTEGTLNFEPVPAGTRMRWSWRVEAPGSVKLISPLVIVWAVGKNGASGASSSIFSSRRADDSNRATLDLAWIGAAALGVANGVSREMVYADAVGDETAHVISTGTLLALLGGYISLLQRRWPLENRREAQSVGGAWAAMTVVFEFGFGHWVDGDSWSELLENYDVTEGKVWVLVPATMAAGPELARRLTTRHAAAAKRPAEPRRKRPIRHAKRTAPQ